MNNFVNSLKSVALSVGEIITPILTESKFKETGVLTPEEYVAAGDHLVHHCPTWSWSKASEGKNKDFLPLDKQFLITKHVPCHQRCNQIQYNEKNEKIINESSEETINEWVDTHYYCDNSAVSSTTKELLNLSSINNTKIINNNSSNVDNDDEDDDDGSAVDMSSFLESSHIEEEDPNLFVCKSNVDGETNLCADLDEELLHTRTYDLHITYDKYYQVPRFWLVGYDEQNKPLTVDQMKEDFSQDHADKTITLEAHPHLSNLSLATIHPCRHASVMKRLIEQFLENGKVLSVLDYLFIFLKFVQAVIPTVEYDYTRSIQF